MRGWEERESGLVEERDRWGNWNGEGVASATFEGFREGEMSC
jgi:hypothetical protein